MADKPQTVQGFAPHGQGGARTSDAPFDNPHLVAPSGTFPANSRGFIVLTGGVVEVTHANGTTLLFGTLQAGQVIPIAGLATSTSTSTVTVAAGL